MKGRRVLAIVLCLALALGLVGTAAAAVEPFGDLPESHWAYRYIMDMAERGLFQGYGDANNSVKPDDLVVNSVALTLCARMAVPDSGLRSDLEAAYAKELTEIFGEDDRYFSWFRKEAATCLELGIISYEDLAWLREEDLLNTETTKGEFAQYLVRAMGVEDLARSISDTSLQFNDALDIAESLRPYVKLLNAWGVVDGDDKGNFNGDSGMNRAVCATMLSRAMEQVESRRIAVELPRYADCAWDSGYVKSVDVEETGTRVLTLESAISGEKRVTLPTGAVIYQYNVPTERTALKAGAFARVCYAADGKTVESVRVTPASRLTEVSGKCALLSQEQVVVDDQLYTIDRFTEVSAGGDAGDRTSIDLDASYTDVTLVCDANDRVLHMSLTGGTRQVNGILKELEVVTVGLYTKTTLVVSGYNGATTSYSVPDEAWVLIGGVGGTLKESLKGRHITLRVADEDLTLVRGVEVNPAEQYIQGILQVVNAGVEPRTVYITVTGAERQTRYELSADCAVSFAGAEVELSQVATGSFVTAKLEGGTITWLAGYHGYDTVSGVLTAITYGDTTVLKVTKADGTVSTFSIPQSKLSSVKITRNKAASDISRLRTGDQVAVSLLYNEVDQIDSIPQEANVTGTLQSVTRNADGSAVLVVALGEGSTGTYTADSATTVTRGDTVSNIASLQPNERVNILAEGTRAVSIEVSGAVVNREQVAGSVYQVDTAERTILLLVEDGQGGQALVTVKLATGASVWDITDNATVSGMNRIHVGDMLQFWGSYDVSGAFAATSGVRVVKAG